MNRMRVGLIGAVILAGTGGALLAESVWVKTETVELRSGQGAVYPVVGAAKKGAELTVVSRDGKWIQVSSGGVQGWVYEAALSPQKVSGGGGFFPNGTPGAAEMSTGAAAKGLQPGAESYVSAKGLSKQPLESLIAFRKTITPAEWERFVADGNLKK